jgi:hypothetical protein
MHKTGLVLEWLQKVDFHFNVSKTVFAIQESKYLEQESKYLEHWLTGKGLQPQPKKVEAIL